MKIVLFAIISYLIGSIPTALIIGEKFFNKDIRNFGSKNLGGTNAGRVLGKKAGFFVSLFDVLKIFIPCLLVKIFFGRNAAAITGFFGMLGHCYPMFAGFKGGKGVSSLMGIAIVLDWRVTPIIFVIWELLKFITNYVSVSSILSCYIVSFLFLFFDCIGKGNKYLPAFFTMLIAASFVTFKHKSNIKRLMSGTENKVRNK